MNACESQKIKKRYERMFFWKKNMNTCIEIFNEDCPVDYLPNTKDRRDTTNALCEASLSLMSTRSLEYCHIKLKFS